MARAKTIVVCCSARRTRDRLLTFPLAIGHLVVTSRHCSSLTARRTYCRRPRLWAETTASGRQAAPAFPRFVNHATAHAHAEPARSSAYGKHTPTPRLRSVPLSHHPGTHTMTGEEAYLPAPNPVPTSPGAPPLRCHLRPHSLAPTSCHCISSCVSAPQRSMPVPPSAGRAHRCLAHLSAARSHYSMRALYACARTHKHMRAAQHSTYAQKARESERE